MVIMKIKNMIKKSNLEKKVINLLPTYEDNVHGF